jgi:hypothetical protein
LAPKDLSRYYGFTVRLRRQEWAVLLWRLPVLEDVEKLQAALGEEAIRVPLLPLPPDYEAAPRLLLRLAQVSNGIEPWRWGIAKRGDNPGYDRDAWLSERWATWADMRCSPEWFQSMEVAGRAALDVIIAASASNTRPSPYRSLAT